MNMNLMWKLLTPLVTVQAHVYRDEDFPELADCQSDLGLAMPGGRWGSHLIFNIICF